MSSARRHDPLPDGSGGASRPIGVELVERLRAGDAAAFEQVYGAYHVRLHAFLLRLTRDRALARDLAQETWLRLAANARRLVPDSDPGAWLFAVARNLYLSRRRWALLDQARRLQLSFQLSFRARDERATSPLEHACGDQLQRALERALATLALPEREVMLLVCMEGFAPHEVAVMLGIRASAVRKRLSRARARVRAALPEELWPEKDQP